MISAQSNLSCTKEFKLAVKDGQSPLFPVLCADKVEEIPSEDLLALVVRQLQAIDPVEHPFLRGIPIRTICSVHTLLGP